MFKRLEYYGSGVVALIDSEFDCNVRDTLNTFNIIRVIPLIVQEYEKREKAVAKNIALLCCWINRNSAIYGGAVNIITNKNCDWIDINYPELQFSKKYHQCIINQIKKLEFSKSNKKPYI